MFYFVLKLWRKLIEIVDQGQKMQNMFTFSLARKRRKKTPLALELAYVC